MVFYFFNVVIGREALLPTRDLFMSFGILLTNLRPTI